jgi:glutaryl-CoA dehydrogenase (non-decarboxylating)
LNLDLTDEQLAIQETVREFVDRRIMPVAQENDINHHLDMGIIEGMAELGLLGRSSRSSGTWCRWRRARSWAASA